MLLAGQRSGMFRIELHDGEKSHLLGLDLDIWRGGVLNEYDVLLPLCKSYFLRNNLDFVHFIFNFFLQ